MFPVTLLTLPLLALSAPTAQGPLPLGGAPAAMDAATTSVLQLANFLENLEYALYSGACSNFTDADFDSAGFPSGYRTDVVCKTAEQEMVHIETIEMALKAGEQMTIPACEYSFPYNGTVEFVYLANMVTSVGIGAYIGGSLSLTSSLPLLGASNSILPVEARHSAVLRYNSAAKLSPFPSAFETALSAPWAYNLALPFTTSCPMYLNISKLPALNQTAPPAMPPMAPMNGTSNFTFAWDPTAVPETQYASFAWVNGASNVTFEPVQSCGVGCGISAVPAGAEGAAFVVLTNMNASTIGNMTETMLSNYTLAGPAEVILS